MSAARVGEGLAAAVLRHAAERPAAPAVIEPGYGLDYAELAGRGGGLRRALVEAGVGPGSTVAAAVYGLGDVAVAAVGACGLGAALYLVDIRLAPDLRAERLDLAESAAVVLAGFPDGPWTGRLPVIHLDEVEPRAEPAPSVAVGPFVLEGEGSGTLLRITESDARQAAAELSSLLGPDDRVLLLGLPNAGPVVHGLTGCLLAGAAAVSPSRSANSADELIKSFRGSGATVLVAAPHAAWQLAEAAEEDGDPLETLRLVLLPPDRPPARLPGLLRRAAAQDCEIRPVFGVAAPAPVEELIETWSAVRMARIVRVGGGRVAFVETRGTVRVDPAALLASLRAQIPAAGLAEDMLPTLVVNLPAMPVTSSGAVDCAALASRAEAILRGPVLPSGPAVSAAGPSAADTAPARILATVAEILVLPNLAADANLYEVGATSVEIVRAVAELEESLGFEVDLNALLDAPCVQTMIESYLGGGAR